MLRIIFLLLAILLFFLAAANQTIFNQPPPDLDAFAGAAVALALLFWSYGPAARGIALK
jgi:hypothetical protein